MAGDGRQGGGRGHPAAGATTPRDTALTELVGAARSGDVRAAEQLISEHLPLLYRVVGRSLEGHTDVDDVVQETVLRAYRDLPALRRPGSFRSWLIAIALHQVSNRQRSWQQDGERLRPLEEAAGLPDPEAEFAEVTALRMGISDQRRQVREAAYWLDPGDRELAALYWREAAGDLTRSELVASSGVKSGHARVRIQRMRRQLDLSRSVVAALAAVPRCPRLDALARDWNGEPGPRWRKRFVRHVHDCAVCGRARAWFVPLERLVVGASLLPVPAGFGSLAAAAVTGGAAAGSLSGAGAGVGAGIAGWFGQALGLKVATAVMLGASVSGGVYLALPDDPPRDTGTAAPTAVPPAPAGPASPVPSASVRPPRAPASPSATGLLPAGRWVLRPAGRPGAVTVDGEQLLVTPGAGITLTVNAGLADEECVTLRAEDGRYVRHASFRVLLAVDENRELFRRDATFCPRRGTADGTVRFASLNYPDRYIRVRDARLVLDPEESGAAYVAESSFSVTGE